MVGHGGLAITSACPDAAVPGEYQPRRAILNWDRQDPRRGFRECPESFGGDD
jgi:hypothetical protein